MESLIRPTVPCLRCFGQGKIPLNDDLLAVLGAVRAGAQTAAQVHAAIKSKQVVTVINNRLETLRRLGLVRRRPSRNGWNYRAIE